MEEKYYLDTSIWMDYYEDRKDHSKDIGEFAFKLLCKLLASKSKVIVSTLLLRELEGSYTLDKVRGLMKPFEKLLEKISIEEIQIKEAKSISRERSLPFGDVLHAILARDNKSILISRDKHFQKLKDICEVLKPEEII